MNADRHNIITAARTSRPGESRRTSCARGSHRHGRDARATDSLRRGNTFVLVTGILVLLVIIATAFVVRTQAGRVTSNATNRTELGFDNRRLIADDISHEIAQALFTRPINFAALTPPFNLNVHVGSNAPRLPSLPGVVPFEQDEQDHITSAANGAGPDGRPDYPYNVPPYAVIPYTNWPDPATLYKNGGSPIAPNWPGGNGAPAAWPGGPGNPTGASNAPLLAGEYNLLGDPGFGDCRWLRDLEPLRWSTAASLNSGPLADAFSHWRHMTNIARPDNAYRIVFDVSDVGDSNNDGYGRLVTDLNVPVEQFPAMPNYPLLNPATGDTNVALLNITNPDTTNGFLNQWGNWLGVSNAGMGGYITAITKNTAPITSLIPPNFLRLRDLDADGVLDEVGERPQDEFAGPGVLPQFPNGAPRWQVGRILADTDGDGYTDAFWFLAPSPVQSGVRTIVAMSIVDNSAMLNANVATRFIRSDPTAIPQKTRGLTPTDLSLVGQGRATQYGNFNCGLYDTWDNWLILAPEINTSYDTDLTLGNPNNLWFRHLTEVGLVNNANVALDFPTTAQRLDYWRKSASRGLSADPQTRYSPFTLGDELELRMYAGQNYPWIASRFEWSAGSDVNGNGYGPFRGNVPREESSEYLDQLYNRQLVVDVRHKTTLYNGARNDLLPPWLWLYGPNKDLNGDGVINAADADLNLDVPNNGLFDRELFLRGTRKFDLRLPYGTAANPVWLVGDWDDPVTPPTPRDYELANNFTALQFGIALRDRIAVALMDTYDNLPTNRGTYYGNAVADIASTQELCAAYAANIAQWRDRNQWHDSSGAVINPQIVGDPNGLASYEVAPLREAIPVSPSPTVAAPTARFLGLEPQPFLVEAFVGHIYSDPFGAIPPADAANHAYSNAGQHVVVEEADHQSTVIAVQIANPYDRPINFNVPPDPTIEHVEYEVRVFGQSFPLNDLGLLEPATEDMPATLILYAIKDDIGNGSGLRDKWTDFLDINTVGLNGPLQNLTPNTKVVRVPTGRWDIDSRALYDTSGEPAIEIRRRTTTYDQGGNIVIEPWVTIDRMDNLTARRFGEAINQMQANAPPPPAPDPPNLWIHPAGEPYPGIDIGIDGSGYDHWVQWVRATRAWGVDVNNDNVYSPNERSPRYVFGDYAVCSAAGAAADITDPANTGTVLNGGNRYKFGNDPDGPPPASPWFTRPYMREDPATPGTNLPVLTRKPTFFDLDNGENPPPPTPGVWSFPNKGWYAQKGAGTPDDAVIDTSVTPAIRQYRTPFAFQMLHKDGDFEQIGEILNVFLYGHKLEFSNNTSTGTFTGLTIATFSEYLSEAAAPFTGYQDPNFRYRVNRLLMVPINTGAGRAGAMVGVGDPTIPDDPRHGIPDLPAGVRLLDSFVCDSYGCEPLGDIAGPPGPPTFGGPDGVVDAYDREARSLLNAKGFDGTATPGLININSAPPEVARCLPHLYRLVHEFGSPPGNPSSPYFNAKGQPLVTTANDTNAELPRVMLPEAMKQYAEHFNGKTTANGTGIPNGPDYEQRVNSPGGRGFNSIGEVNLLGVPAQYPVGYVDRPASNSVDRIYNEQWRIDMNIAGMPVTVGTAIGPKPFWSAVGAGGQQLSMRLSTDRQDSWDPFANVPGTPRADGVAGDVEEANMLFAGMSNMITTRSDVFTVYFKVRTFRQNTSVNPPRWDATNPEYIIDDSRYVMLVDRSGVNHPGDAPKILYLERLPN